MKRGIKVPNSGFAKCCPPTGNKADIIERLIANDKGKDKCRKTNLNKVARDKACKIPGITSKIATAIIEARETFGKFKDFDDLIKRIFGFGKKKADDLKRKGIAVIPLSQLLPLQDENETEPRKKMRLNVSTLHDQTPSCKQ